MSSWSLDINGSIKTLADWKVNGVVLRRLNLAPDSLVFTAPRAKFDDPDLFAYGETARLIKTLDDLTTQVWFKGTRQIVPGEAEAASEAQTYTCVSPWQWLAQNVFQQQWYNGTVYTSHVISIGSIGAIIKAVLDYAIANGALLQYVQADLNLLSAFPPTNEFTGKYCTAVMLDALQFAPDTIGYFDYSTSTPTLRFKQRPSLPAATVQMADYTGSPSSPIAAGIRITPRPDLQVPSVKINFETITTVNGEKFLVPGVDVWPPGATGREDGAFNDTVTLRGSTVNTVFGALECDAIPAFPAGRAFSPTNEDWFLFLKRHIPILREPGTVVVSVDGGGITTPVQRLDPDGNPWAIVYTSELIEGSIAPWMKSGGVALKWQREIFKVTLHVLLYQDAGNTTLLTGQGEKDYTFEIITCTAPAGHSEYMDVESTETGDPPIVNLAHFLYDALNPLHYESSIELRERECSRSVDLGQKLNLLGSRAEYAAMNALVQEVVYQIDSGSTQISCGPPKHLSLTDILALLERFRARTRWTNPDTQATGALDDNDVGNVELGKPTRASNTITGDHQPHFFSVVPPSQTVPAAVPVASAVTFDASSPFGAVHIKLSDCNGKTLTVREVEVCVNNVTKRMMVIGSAAY